MSGGVFRSRVCRSTAMVSAELVPEVNDPGAEPPSLRIDQISTACGHGSRRAWVHSVFT